MTPASISARRLAAGLTIAIVGALAAACGTNGPAPAPTATVTRTIEPAADASGSSGQPATSAPAAASSGPARAPGCLAADLQPQLGASQGTAGTIYQVVILTNSSGQTCTLYGYPGVSFVSGPGGSQIGKPATKNTVIAPSLITLAPGQQANLLLGIHDAGAYPPATCHLTTVSWLKIYPPGDYGAVYVQYKTQACAGKAVSTMSVTTVRAGAGSADY
jgi:hypothetical protein